MLTLEMLMGTWIVFTLFRTELIEIFVWDSLSLTSTTLSRVLGGCVTTMTCLSGFVSHFSVSVHFCVWQQLELSVWQHDGWVWQQDCVWQQEPQDEEQDCPQQARMTGVCREISRRAKSKAWK